MEFAEEHEKYPAASFLKRLLLAGSSLGDQLTRALDLPLGTYLDSLVPTGGPNTNRHRETFAAAVVRHLEGFGTKDAAAVGEHLLRTPVIQQADHSNLLLDPETFLNNYLFHLAWRGVRERPPWWCPSVRPSAASRGATRSAARPSCAPGTRSTGCCPSPSGNSRTPPSAACPGRWS
ncbi:hypothetical protein GXW82_31420 [Streptacidiphilus sp. 4-A2]|nr:hypothetical protein [Streptacidiphilus sp. 4-A2]